MSEHAAKISWSRGDRAFSYETYSRDHTWAFDGGVLVPATAAAAFLGNPARVVKQIAKIKEYQRSDTETK